MPVDGLERSVGQSDTDSGTGDTHGGRDGERVLRENEHGQSGTHLHGTSSRRRVVGNLVTHDLHNVETVGAQTQRDGKRQDGQLPWLDGELGSGGVSSLPGRVDDGPWSNRVSDIIGTVGKRGGTGGDDLDKRVGMFDLVGILVGIAVNLLHSSTFRGTGDTRLSGVDIIVDTVHETDDDLSRDSLDDGLDIVQLVNGTGTSSVGVKVSHGPTEWTLVLSHLGVESLLCGGKLLLVGELELVQGGLLWGSCLFLASDRRLVFNVASLREDRLVDGLVNVGIVLHDGIVGDHGEVFTVGRGGSLEEEGSHERVVPLDGRVSLDDLGVNVGDEKEGRQDKHAESDTEDDRGNVPSGFLVETELGRSLVDDRQSADGRGDEEEKGGRVD